MEVSNAPNTTGGNFRKSKADLKKNVLKEFTCAGSHRRALRFDLADRNGLVLRLGLSAGLPGVSVPLPHIGGHFFFHQAFIRAFRHVPPISLRTNIVAEHRLRRGGRFTPPGYCSRFRP